MSLIAFFPSAARQTAPRTFSSRLASGYTSQLRLHAALLHPPRSHAPIGLRYYIRDSAVGPSKRAVLVGLSVVAVGLAHGFLRSRQGAAFASLGTAPQSGSSSSTQSTSGRRHSSSAMNHNQAVPGRCLYLAQGGEPPPAIGVREWLKCLAHQLDPLLLLRSAQRGSMDDLVDYLKDDGVIKSAPVEAAMRAVDRAHFCDPSMPRSYKYQDHPLPIGYGETISAPHMHATCLELLREHLVPGARVLDVGSGSGYLTAAMALMVGPSGKVIGIEKHPQLAQLSVRNVRAATPQFLDNGVIELRAGNVLGDVLEVEEPFDAIHVGAAAATLPENLVLKLKPGGRMVIPVGPQWDYQVMQCVDKDREGHVHKHNLMYVRYVPLTKPGETDTEE